MACAGLEFPPPSKLMVAQRFPKLLPHVVSGHKEGDDNREYVINLEKHVQTLTNTLRVYTSYLEKSYDFTLELMGDALELRDVEYRGHSRRVTAYTIAIARAMGVSKNDIAVFARGAFLRNVARLGIPDLILKKRPPLNAEEMSTMREHCVLGYRMLRRIPFLQDASEIVYAQYADKALGVATSIDGAREAIRKLSGKQFDPKIVQVFLRMPITIWSDLRREIEVWESK